MKKLLLFCLAGMLVIALTIPVAAKTTLATSGRLSVGGYYLTNPMATSTTSTAVSSAFMTIDLQLNFKYNINPALSANIQLAALGGEWGGSTTAAVMSASSRYNNGATPGTLGFNAVEIEAANIVWIVYKGYVFAGYGKDASTGSLGPLMRSKVSANRNWSSGDGMYYRFMTSQTFGPWNIFALYQKLTEGDMGIVSTDDDLDAYNPVLRYTWKTGSAALSWWYGRYRNSSQFYEQENHSFTPSVWQKFGNFAVGAKMNYVRNSTKTAADGYATAAKTDGYYWLVTGEYAAGPYKLGAYVSVVHAGSLITNDRVMNGPGTDFRGLYAAFGPWDGLLYDSTKYSGNSDFITFGEGAGDTGGGLQLFYGFAEYKLMEKMWVMAALGFMRFDAVPPAGAGKTLNTDYGTEFDLGMNYTIMKGLDLGVHFGYFIPGTFFAAGAKGNHLHIDWELVMKF